MLRLLVFPVLCPLLRSPLPGQELLLLLLPQHVVPQPLLVQSFLVFSQPLGFLIPPRGQSLLFQLLLIGGSETRHCLGGMVHLEQKELMLSQGN